MKKKNHKITKITNDFDTQTMAAPQDERLPFLYLSFCRLFLFEEIQADLFRLSAQNGRQTFELCVLHTPL